MRPRKQPPGINAQNDAILRLIKARSQPPNSVNSLDQWIQPNAPSEQP